MTSNTLLLLFQVYSFACQMQQVGGLNGSSCKNYIGLDNYSPVLQHYTGVSLDNL